MTAKLNRTIRCTAAALAVVALGAGVTACGPSNGSSSSGGTPSGTATVSSSGPQGGTQGMAPGSSAAGAKKGRTGSGSGGAPSSGTSRSSAASGASGRCRTGELNYRWNSGGPDMNATNQQIASVGLTNIGKRTCTLHGFPGIRLISKSGEAWDLPRSKDKPSTITLRPGESTAEITLDILPVPANTRDTRPFAPSKVLITPPDETTHVTLAWPYGGAVWHQAGATADPETSVNPVGF